MTELRQSRWVKIHEPGQANYAETDNVMDIKIGGNRCQADVLYTVRSYKKAAYWLGEYLKAAEALQIVADEMLAKIQDAAASTNREEDEMAADGDGWNCTIERMGDGSFKVQLSWAVSEPVTKKTKEKPAPKKRGRKKKEAE